MRAPPDNRNARGEPGVGKETAIESRKPSDSELPAAAQAAKIIAATERAEDLLALWRQQRSLAHRIRLAMLRFQLVGLDPDEQDRLAAEVHAFHAVCFALAERFRDRGAAYERQVA
jgi:hypothetical protein